MPKPKFTPTPFQNNFYNQFVKILKLQKRIRTVEVDFEKKPINVVQKYIGRISASFLYEGLGQIYISSFYFILAYIFATKNYDLIWYFLGFYIIKIPFDAWFIHIAKIAKVGIEQSIKTSAHKFFLEIDPKNYIHKSTGEIMSKINRGSVALPAFLDSFNVNLFPVFVGIITSTVIISNIYPPAGLASIVFLLITFLFRISVSKKLMQTFVHKGIKAGDKFSTTSTETLFQLGYIRSLFATPEQYQKIQNYSQKSYLVTIARIFFATSLHNVARIFNTFGLITISIMMIDKVQTSGLATEIALTAIISYFNNSRNVNSLSSQIQEAETNFIEFNDLWAFIRNFGTQSFPVLEESLEEDLRVGSKEQTKLEI